MNKFYFAKDKEMNELYIGMKQNVGFAKIGDLKRSITYKYKDNRSNKTKDDYDFYCVNTKNMKIEKVE